MKLKFSCDTITIQQILCTGGRNMYQAGDRVLYGMHGVCCVKAAEERVLDGTKRLFLVLEPEGQTGCQYLVPTHNAAAMAK